MIIRIDTDDVGYWVMNPQNNNEYFWTNRQVTKFSYWENLNIIRIVRFRMLSINLILNEYVSVIYKSIDILQYYRLPLGVPLFPCHYRFSMYF